MTCAMALLLILVASILLAVGAPSRAQVPPAAPAAEASAPTVLIPGYWDPRRRTDRVDLTRVPQIRFLTDDELPPFGFPGPDGRPAGFNVDLARAICEELKVPCTIQARRLDLLAEGLDRNAGDAVIASLAITPDLRRRFEVSDRYLDTPARFVMRKDTRLTEATPEALAGRSIAVVQGSAHEAYAATFYPTSSLRRFADIASARKALLERDVDVLFADGIASGFWITGEASADCCRFLGGAFTENRYFGEGLAIVMRRGNEPLRRAINHALQRLWEKGIYADLVLKAFPGGVY